jgi:chromosome condensin MukBEF ATPase and DNA-binding subunit MukB
MTLEELEYATAEKYIIIKELKNIKDKIEDSDEPVKFIIQTKHWYGYTCPALEKRNHKVDISKEALLNIINKAIYYERDFIIEYLDEIAKRRKFNDTMTKWE